MNLTLLVLGVVCLKAVVGQYSCSVSSYGMRIHEMTSPTPYDCTDNSCGNTCIGGQPVALVTCSCTRNGQWAPATNCWSPGDKIMGSDGRCNRNIGYGTAIATFDSNGNYYTGHAAIFIGCVDDYTVQVYDQTCCRAIGYVNYSSGSSFWSAFAVITNPSCVDRSSWPCRIEAAGSTCCPTSVEYCKASKYWWKPFV